MTVLSLQIHGTLIVYYYNIYVLYGMVKFWHSIAFTIILTILTICVCCAVYGNMHFFFFFFFFEIHGNLKLHGVNFEITL